MIKIGNFKTTWDVLVADITVNAILGLDILVAHNAMTDLKNLSVKLKKDIVKAEMIKTDGKQSTVARMTLKMKIVEGLESAAIIKPTHANVKGLLITMDAPWPCRG